MQTSAENSDYVIGEGENGAETRRAGRKRKKRGSADDFKGLSEYLFVFMAKRKEKERLDKTYVISEFLLQTIYSETPKLLVYQIISIWKHLTGLTAVVVIIKVHKTGIFTNISAFDISFFSLTIFATFQQATL